MYVCLTVYSTIHTNWSVLQNSNGQVIWVKDGWGGELNTEESSSADIVIEAWKNGPTPAWRSTVTITAQKSSYKELRHGAKTLPDYLQVQVKILCKFDH